MTPSEYKKLVPEHAHLEGDALWDAMTHYALDHPDQFQQQAEKIMFPKPSGEMPYKHYAIFIPGSEKEPNWWQRLWRRIKLRKFRGKLPTTVGSGKSFKKVRTKGNYTTWTT